VFDHITDLFFRSLKERCEGNWLPILWSKLTKSEYSPLFVALAFRNVLQYRHGDFKKFIRSHMVTSSITLVNIGPVTPEFKKCKNDQQFGYVA